MPTRSRAPRRARRAGLAAALALLFGLAFGGGAAVASGPGDDPAAAESAAAPSGDAPPMLCEIAIRAAEQARRLPLHLMQAIAFVESGRMSDAHGRRIAWPWTVMAEGRGRYYDSKAEAIAAVRALQDRGVENIDVGCMQVNLYYHGRAFASLEEAFDPVHNVAYATAFLLDLRREANSWTKAIKRYHSRTPERQALYQARVQREWRALKHGRSGWPGALVALPAQSGGLAASADRADGAAVVWPPRSYHEQKRLENAMRARVLTAQP
ncbi:MAG: transglycosylase SLT domain-containing protein [Alphaproteobacteria bacterium]|nr:transglycosylase SLT domain-containing protein [Alphaproteobacteria bacterium]